jgi:hypothetical protein
MSDRKPVTGRISPPVSVIALSSVLVAGWPGHVAAQPTIGRTIVDPTTLRVEFTRTSRTSASARLYADGELLASEDLTGAFSVFIFSSNETFDIGKDTGTMVLDGSRAPYPFSGKIGKVTFTVKPSG